MRSGAFSWAIGLLFAVLAAGSAFAQDDGDWEPHDRVAAGQIQPLDRILPEIRRTHPGTFYDAEGPFTGPDGEMHYRLKWMTPDGRVVWYDANARTGRVMGSGSGRRDYQSFDTGPMRGGPDQYNGGGNGRRFHDDENDGRDRFGSNGYNGQGPGNGQQGPPDWHGGRGNGRDWGGPGFGHDRGGWGGRGWQGGRGGWPGGGGGGDHHGGGHGGHGGY
jgi:hypothetical protein